MYKFYDKKTSAFQHFFIVIVCLVTVFSMACNRISKATDGQATLDSNVSISIKETVKWMKNGRPALTVVISNVGAADAWDVACTINVMTNNNRLLESKSIDLSNWLSPVVLKSNANTVFEVTLFNADSHEDYLDVNFEFSWIEKYDNTVVVSSKFFSQSL